MSGCEHVPRCSRLRPDYCWPAEYVELFAHMMRSDGLDPVQLNQRLGYIGRAARIREYLDRYLAAR